MIEIKLAEALLRRKELAAKVQITSQVKTANLYQEKIQRVRVTEGLDDITATVPKLLLAQVTHENDFYASQLRKIDAAIQQTNWTAKLEVDDNAMRDYMDAYPDAHKKFSMKS